MENLQYGPYDTKATSNKKWNSNLFFIINYGLIAIVNAVQFGLLANTRHKIDNHNIDRFRIRYLDPLELCLAVACLTWVFLTYGIIRRFRPDWIPFWGAAKKWDHVVTVGIIWALQLSAAITQSVFVRVYSEQCNIICNILNNCSAKCDQLDQGSISMNIAFAIIAWVLCVAWTPQFVWAFLHSHST